MKRFVESEILDELPPQSAEAARARRDLRSLNAVMNHPAVMAGALGAALDGDPGRRRVLVELGAGDGHFLLEVAQRLEGGWRNVEAVLVDRLDAYDPATRAGFGRFGWRIETETAEAAQWLRNGRARPADAVISNLLLHQFEEKEIREIFRLASRLSPVFIALEPRRAPWPLFCSRLLRFIGCGPVTRHDAPVSVRAGFMDSELSALWPAVEPWTLAESRAGRFSHLFIARK